MTKPVMSDTDADNFIRDYLASDQYLAAFARQRGIKPNTAYHWLRERGIETSRRGSADRIPVPDLPELVGRYETGESVKVLAVAHDVSRSVIVRWLERGGAQLRDRSDAMHTRMANTSAAERQRLATAANAARRGATKSASEKALQAQARTRFVGAGERELATALEVAGITVDTQCPVGSYNVDIACWPVAVEVHRNTNHPMRWPKHRQRIKYLADHGWRVLYVWCSRGPRRKDGACCISGHAVNEVVAHIQAAQRDPSAVREHRVIRCTGEDAP